MVQIAEEMICECYEAFQKGNINFVPKGMNETYARMTMDWLDCIINTLQPYNRSGSLMQYELILEKIKNDYGVDRATKAAESLLPYCLKTNRQSHISILKRYIIAVSPYE